MLLDRLLSNLDVTLRPFVVSEVASGWRMRLGRADWVTVHFVLAGSGRLRTGSGQPLALPLHSLALVPAGQAHTIETGDPVEHEVTATQPRPREDQLDVYEAGPHDPDELLVACGWLQARHESGPGLFDGLKESLASAASMSRSAFSEIFKARLGQSPMAYLRAVRLRQAASLLRRHELTVDQVAARSGYSSRSQFSRAFSAQFGVSPSQFRSAAD